ncbi:hypothetical protein LOK49_LG03G01960 [Camellia lanceoleosa]|uniref:Uncharacterized protein n=1 Tax=Camellia lanceoleosa TaxID=1840588 RepID=A0ACC0IFB0_9ERIC|nr:hypothetical protein LOK49_LG03G01960 [Camellia lanceoleosa]
MEKPVNWQYEIGEVIGSGAFGVVYKGLLLETKQTVAIKKMHPLDLHYGVPSTIMEEISLLEEMEHDNIVRLLEALPNTDKEGYMIFEYLDYDLDKFIKKFPEISKNKQRIKNFMRQILSGLAYCHELKIIHRDLRPANLLVDYEGSVVKIADFGLARKFGSPLGEYCPEVVNLCYMPPEILLGSHLYTTHVDVWSVGCIFAEMINHQRLCNEFFEKDCLNKIFSIMGTPDATTWPGVTSLPDYKPDDFPKQDPKNLAEYVPNLEPAGVDLLSCIMHQILSGVIYCHKHRIMHQDLKPDNLLIDLNASVVKIADFGMARAFHIPLRAYSPEVLTIWYRAPEILLGSLIYSTAIDVWSAGCIFAKMLICQNLFAGASKNEHLRKIFSIMGTPNERTWPGVTSLPYYPAGLPEYNLENLEEFFVDLEPAGVDLLSNS